MLAYVILKYQSFMLAHFFGLTRLKEHTDNIFICFLGNWDEWKGPSEDNAGYNGAGETEYYEPNVDDPDFNVSRTIHSHLWKEFLINIFEI